MLIDTPADEAGATADFWAAALGGPAQRSTDEPEYTRIGGGPAGLAVVVQAVDDAPRYHLDIETDDVAAETARLIGLGATVVTDHGGYQILRAPGGHLLCVVPIQSPEDLFAADSQVWP
jgi:hypothetical protein